MNQLRPKKPSENDLAPGLSVNLAPNHGTGLLISNPIMIASGTFGYDGYGRGILDNVDLSPTNGAFTQLGAIIPKTVTMLPKDPNPEPRWYPTSFREGRDNGDCVYLNSIGLANPGIDRAIRELAPTWAQWNVPAILSISADSTREFGIMASMADGVPGIAAIELNLSCPNIKNGAHFSHNPKLSAQAVSEVKRYTSLPVIPKLSPNVPDISTVATAVEEAGADAITLTNTIPAMAIDVTTGKPILGGITGGLSGPGLHPIAVAAVYRASQHVAIPIIGVGGIFTADDVLEFIFAGATAVQIGSANLARLTSPLEILSELRSYLEQHGIKDVSTLIGTSWS